MCGDALLDYSVERAALVVQWLSRLANTLLSSTQCQEIPCRLGHDVRVEREDHTANRFAADGDVEESNRAIGVWFRHRRALSVTKSELKMVVIGKPGRASAGSKNRRCGTEGRCKNFRDSRANTDLIGLIHGSSSHIFS